MTKDRYGYIIDRSRDNVEHKPVAFDKLMEALPGLIDRYGDDQAGIRTELGEGQQLSAEEIDQYKKAKTIDDVMALDRQYLRKHPRLRMFSRPFCLPDVPEKLEMVGRTILIIYVNKNVRIKFFEQGMLIDVDYTAV